MSFSFMFLYLLASGVSGMWQAPPRLYLVDATARLRASGRLVVVNDGPRPHTFAFVPFHAIGPTALSKRAGITA